MEVERVLPLLLTQIHLHIAKFYIESFEEETIYVEPPNFIDTDRSKKEVSTCCIAQTLQSLYSEDNESQKLQKRTGRKIIDNNNYRTEMFSRGLIEQRIIKQFKPGRTFRFR